MARPTIQRAVANANITADMWNDNFDGIMAYADDAVEEMEDYVDTFMPSQTGNNGKFLKTNGTAASWSDLMTEFANLPTAQYINGLEITKNSSSPNDTIDVAPGSCFDSTNTKILILSSVVTKQKTDLAVSTTYYVYLIAKADLSAYDILITTSSSSPTLPANYTLYRLIGSLTTNSSSKIDEIDSYSSSAKVGYNYMPNFSAGIGAGSGFVAPTNGWIYCVSQRRDNGAQWIGIAGVISNVFAQSNGDYFDTDALFFPLPKGKSISSISGTFYPCIGA